MNILKLEMLSKEAFAPFGEVIEIEGSDWHPINGGTTRRYHHLAPIDAGPEGGRPGISMARGQAFSYPVFVSMLERHPAGSQAWIPCTQTAFLVVVAPNGPDGRPDETGLRAFRASGSQGVNYRAGTWHHPLTTLDRQGDFIIVDRVDGAPNCDEADLRATYLIDGSLKGA
ncbi:ureidoglycolate lyase [Parapusillimonas granuli]|uniref:Ureidoglycolate lyase n=1 Tax=Parapusillimonas granuli TaxID=380911 RepID=A0A853G1N6_9BURK|nr:ureidoglycolate lyase [Parapusillimonas granuli]MBB5217037.1 ureidoglycolate lyase [Parapusillimonas granuli]MEB2400633.1 ureidoglycolate lyase [Alcaligenaceae bacterium]NYT50199.1 ureidoglycolate lyase [Parapusillimonas granuli]